MFNNKITIYCDTVGIYTLSGNNVLWESDILPENILNQVLTRWYKLCKMSGGDVLGELVGVYLEGWQVIEKVNGLIRDYKLKEKYYV